MLQFDVMLHRLEHEYGAPFRLEKIPTPSALGDRPEGEIERIARDRGRMLLYDAKGHPLILFEDAWDLRWALENETSLTFYDVSAVVVIPSERQRVEESLALQGREPSTGTPRIPRLRPVGLRSE